MASLHDQIVELLGRELRRQHPNKGVTTNPGGEHNFGVRKKYPDAIVHSKKPTNPAEQKYKVDEIYEVEDDKSVTDDQAENQWLPYSKFPYPLTIVVPDHLKAKAKKLLKKYKIDGYLWTYDIDLKGSVEFSST